MIHMYNIYIYLYIVIYSYIIIYLHPCGDIYIYIYTCMCILFSFHIHVLKFENTTVAYAERTPSCIPMNPMTLAHQEAETQTSGFWQ